MRSYLAGIAGLCVVSAPLTSTVYAGTPPVTATSAILTGAPDTAFGNANAAVGSITGDTTYGGLNPFNPAFAPSQIVRLDPGNSLTLTLSAPVPTNGKNLGVFSSVGFVDNSSDGSGLTDSLPSTFDQVLDSHGNYVNSYFQAIVSVSQDGTHFVDLNGGQPIPFTNPTNCYTDTAITNGYQPLGATTSTLAKPFLGTINNFANETYGQIKSTLNGSAGGTWLDLRYTGISSVNAVRFTVPTGANYQAVIDAVVGTGAVQAIRVGLPIISEAVGTGINTSNVVVDFGDRSYDFAVHYDGSITGEAALQMIEADSYFQFAFTHYSFGDYITGFDYGGYDDKAAGSNYWHYWTSPDGVSWTQSGVGAGTRTLTDGSYDGWRFSAANIAPVTPLATVPEPAIAGVFAATAVAAGRRRRR